jgi:hypothetical protein
MSLPALPDRSGLPALPSGMCPLCGAETAPGQEYCLECGERLTGPPALTGEAVAQMLPFTRPSWFWPAVVSFFVAALAVTFVAFSHVLHKKPKVLNATTPIITVVKSHTTTAPGVTTSLATPSTPATTPAKPRSNALSEWPASKSSGYTIVLASLPAASGRSEPTALAHKALLAGLTQVGILDSKRFASLHPGYFVVFSGIFDSYASASAALSQAHANGFNAAYVRQVSR